MFEDFWRQFPRKVARKAALAVWNKMTDIQQTQALQAIPFHARTWRIEGREPHKIPHASTWLHQERWTDELDDPAPKKPAKDTWYETENGILAKAKEMGVSPRRGESWSGLKARIREAIAEAEHAS